MGHPLEYIIVGFDGSDHAAAALRWALDFSGDAAGDSAAVRAVAAIGDAGVELHVHGDHEASAEAQVIAFLKAYVPKGKSPMCGNSICQDRRFLARYMPRLEAYFHYRNVDVSTLKELARRWKPAVLDGFKKAQAHTALADIHESIDEMLYYRQHLLAV